MYQILLWSFEFWIKKAGLSFVKKYVAQICLHEAEILWNFHDTLKQIEEDKLLY